MATYSFGSLTNGQHITFAASTDSLTFDSSVNAGSVALASTTTGLSLTYGGKTVWLDGVRLSMLTESSMTFANGGYLVIGDTTANVLPDWYGQWVDLSTATAGNWVAGLGGADLLETGSGADWLVGNDALTSLNHISRAGSVGSPTQTHSPTISADGRFVGFSGGWTGFGSDANSDTDVFVKDVTNGTFSNEHASASGTSGNSGSGSPVISADGRLLAFMSASSNLVSGSSSSGLYDIYVAGVGTSSIERVSTGTGGVLAANGRSENPDISGTGRYVVFESDTSNWAAGGSTTYSDIFVKDRVTGTLTRVSTSTSGGDGNGDSSNAKISNDGRFIVFQSAATNLTAGDTNGYTDIFVWDKSDGSLTNLSSLMTVVSNPNNSCVNPDVAYDSGWGGKIVFETARSLVAADTNNATDVYAYDMTDDTFQLVSSKADGSSVGVSSGNASISGDGRFVVFTSGSDALVSNDTNGYADVFVKDLFTGAIALVSKTAAGGQSNQHSGVPQISLGGDWIVFESSSTLASTDANGTFTDVYRVSNPLLRDTLSGGAGNDTYVIARTDTIVENAGGGTDTVRSSISYTLGANLENLVLTGTAALNGSGNSLNNLINGNTAANTLSGLAGNDSIVGGAGADTIDGGTGADVVFINALVGTSSDSSRVVVSGSNNDVGQDQLKNFSLTEDAIRVIARNVSQFVHGTDTAIGLTGSDAAGAKTSFTTATGLIELNQTSNDNWADLGDIVVTFSTPSATLTESAFEARLQYVLTGTSTNNILTGGALGDTLDGGVGGDTLTGGAGNDTYVVDAASDIIVEGASAGTDSVVSGVNWTLGATLENLTLSGTTAITGNGNGANNVLTGNAANNSLSGGSGNDTISGGAGNDTLLGGAGNDRLTGSTGADAFRFDSQVGSDTITDFISGTDKLQFRQASLKVGDGDILVEGGVVRAAPGGFATTAELVIFTTNVASLTSTAAAAAIGSATAAYATNSSALFVVDTGTSTGVFRFVSADGNAAVSAAELSLIGTLSGTGATALGDFAFVA